MASQKPKPNLLRTSGKQSKAHLQRGSLRTRLILTMRATSSEKAVEGYRSDMTDLIVAMIYFISATYTT